MRSHLLYVEHLFGQTASEHGTVWKLLGAKSQEESSLQPTD
ncbi:hypothetical protein [Acaryochloris thomasi]|nr:hypothetical protein [Acaryochloris thomasi]